jgi:hypothetical protein
LNRDHLIHITGLHPDERRRIDEAREETGRLRARERALAEDILQTTGFRL